MGGWVGLLPFPYVAAHVAEAVGGGWVSIHGRAHPPGEIEVMGGAEGGAGVT